MSANLNNPAAIPPKSVRAERGRYIAEAQVGGVGEWDWNPAPVGESVGGATLVKVRNAGSNAIKRWEAGSVIPFVGSPAASVTAETEFFEKAANCSLAIETSDCGHGNECLLGVCGTWPTNYEQVYDKAYALEPVVFQVSTSSIVVPTPADLGGWLVAAEDIAVGDYGFAYSAGIHYAMVWDPDDLLDNGGDCRYVDLPLSGAGYDTDDSSPTINLPLQVRANGRARVLAYDRLEYTSTGPGTPQWPMENVRLALIQRGAQFVYPTIPITFTAASLASANIWAYGWEHKHNDGLTSALVGTALNLAESGNTAILINGVSSDDLDDCFGDGLWELQNTFASGQEAMCTLALTTAGAVQPYFQLQNQIIPDP